MCMCRLLYDCKSVKKLHTNDYINTPPVNVAVSRPQRATRSFDTDGYYQLWLQILLADFDDQTIGMACVFEHTANW